MRTSNVELLAEIDTLENIKRVDANELEIVKHIEQQQARIAELEAMLERLTKWMPLGAYDAAVAEAVEILSKSNNQ